MTVERVIDWLGRLSGGTLPADLRSERVMRVDSVLRATIILNTNACALVRLHDIEGRSLQNLQTITGLSPAIIRQNVVQTRIRLSRMLSPGAEERIS
jgi:hypothetical protein